MEEQKLDKIIEKLRGQMVELAATKSSLSDADVVLLSQQLDALLNKSQRRKYNVQASTRAYSPASLNSAAF